jgi:16S rRNA (guanine1207-N2)-methyltransferase
VRRAVYGTPPLELVETPADAGQVSPLVPGAERLEALPDGGLDEFVVAAPAGAVERRYVIAQALRALTPGGALTVLAANGRGGQRLRKELEAFGCEAIGETARRHHRLCVCRRPAQPIGVGEAIEAGGPQFAPRLGLWSQPGAFSWDRPDPGSARLAGFIDDLYGEVADLGCGVGFLAAAVLAAPKVKRLTLIDIDGRAIAAARRNVTDPRAVFLHADIRHQHEALADLDFVVMNPPFHEGGDADLDLGRAFIRRAAASLRRGGICRMVANIALPYDAALAELFREVARLDQGGGYKVYEARK